MVDTKTDHGCPYRVGFLAKDRVQRAILKGHELMGECQRNIKQTKTKIRRGDQVMN